MAIELDDFRWANGATAEITEPPDPKKTVGFVSGDVPPHQYVNWTWNTLYELILQTQGSASYTSLEDAITALTDVSGNPIERTCIIDEYDMDQIQGSINTSTDTGTNVVSIDVSGNGLVYIETGAAAGYAVERDLTTAVATYTLTNAGAIARIITDGRYTAIAYGQYVELFDYLTGVSQWVYDHGTAVADICMDGTRLYLVGNAGTGTHHARGITLSTGVSAWDYDHGGNLTSCAVNGKQVFVSGYASSFGSGATLRALIAATGYDEANEGGTGLDTTDVAWNQVQSTSAVLLPAGLLACDGRDIWCGYGSTETQQLERRSMSDGSVSSYFTASYSITGLAVDRDFVVICNSDNQIIALSKKDLSPVWLKDNATITTNAVASDSTAVFTGTNTGTRTLSRNYRSNRPGIWRRVDLDDNFIPYRQLIIPSE